MLAEHNNEVFKAVDSLIGKLKQAGVYNDTMIVVVSEFPHQNDADGPDKNAHRVDNMPYLVLNSGKSGEYTKQNHGGDIHPGDLHCGLFSKLGVPVNEFGSNAHSATTRRGNNNKKILG